MKLIIWHWTAGGHKANATDKRHYHFIIEGDGTEVAGDQPPEANAVIRSPNDGSTYAAHTRGANTGAIGVAVAAMHGAQERPFQAGAFPITDKQIEALARVTARLCRDYSIPVTRETVMSHAEVERTLGIAQRGKWDITWVPGMAAVGSAVAIGDGLRDRVEAQMGTLRVIAEKPAGGKPVVHHPLASKPVDVSEPAQSDRQSIWARLWARLFAAIFGDWK